MALRDQLDLFDDPAATARPFPSVPVAVPRGAVPLTREQKAFNRLAARVQRLREEVRVWEDYAVRYNQRIASEVEPASARIRAAQRRLVLRLHSLLEASARGERLSRAHRRAVRRHVALVAAEVLSAGPDAEIEAVHDACADTSHAEQAQAELDDLEAALGLVFGEEAVAGHAAHSVDDLLVHAREHVAGQAEAEARRRAQRRGKGSQAAARKARARVEALGTVRAIYRKLASAVHPDREADPEARVRKTLLMQRANEAYARNDVLTLLELQIELEQIDAEHLAGVPAQGLEHLVAVMKEQAATLQAELDERVEHFRMLLDRPSGKLRPAMVERAIDGQLADMCNVTRSVEADLERLDDPRERRAILDAMVTDYSATPEYDEDDPFLLLDALMREAGPPEPRRGRQAGKQRTRKHRRKRR